MQQAKSPAGSRSDGDAGQAVWNGTGPRILLDRLVAYRHEPCCFAADTNGVLTAMDLDAFARDHGDIRREIEKLHRGRDVPTVECVPERVHQREDLEYFGSFSVAAHAGHQGLFEDDAVRRSQAPDTARVDL